MKASYIRVPNPCEYFMESVISKQNTVETGSTSHGNLISSQSSTHNNEAPEVPNPLRSTKRRRRRIFCNLIRLRNKFCVKRNFTESKMFFTKEKSRWKYWLPRKLNKGTGTTRNLGQWKSVKTEGAYLIKVKTTSNYNIDLCLWELSFNIVIKRLYLKYFAVKFISRILKVTKTQFTIWVFGSTFTWIVLKLRLIDTLY